jgi:uncharacterized membrane protein (DUF2068 family)
MDANHQAGTRQETHSAAEIQVLRGVATLEFSKGIVVLLAAGVFLFVVQRESSDLGQDILDLLHISPDHHFARVFLGWADSLADMKTWVVAGVTLAYSTLRFVEAYGLWKARAWAEWIALLSASLYVPFEAYSWVREPNLFHSSLLFINLAVVFYMGYLRITARMRDRAYLEV